MCIKTIIILLLISNWLLAQSLYNGVGHIPLENQVEWYKAGLLSDSPVAADNIFDVTDPEFGANPAPGTYSEDTPAIIAAIDRAKNKTGISIIYFPTGSYEINQIIELNQSNGNNIIFQGDGSNNTTLNFTVGYNKNCFYIHGLQTENLIHLSEDFAMGSNIIFSNNISSLSEGTWIRFSEYNFTR